MLWKLLLWSCQDSNCLYLLESYGSVTLKNPVAHLKSSVIFIPEPGLVELLYNLKPRRRTLSEGLTIITKRSSQLFFSTPFIPGIKRWGGRGFAVHFHVCVCVCVWVCEKKAGKKKKTREKRVFFSFLFFSFLLKVSENVWFKKRQMSLL